MSCSTPYKNPMSQLKATLPAWPRALVALCLALLCAFSGVQASTAPVPPGELARELEKPLLAGSGRLRWLGIPVY